MLVTFLINAVLFVKLDSHTKSDTSNSWQQSGKIKLKLSQIYKSKGLDEAFVDVLFPIVYDTLLVEQNRQKVIIHFLSLCTKKWQKKWWIITGDMLILQTLLKARNIVTKFISQFWHLDLRNFFHAIRWNAVHGWQEVFFQKEPKCWLMINLTGFFVDFGPLLLRRLCEYFIYSLCFTLAFHN